MPKPTLAAEPLRFVIVAFELGATPTSPAVTVVHDVEGRVAARYDATPGTAYLIRPDQHVCARWRAFTPERVLRALGRV